jgi:hypothetical protein
MVWGFMAYFLIGLHGPAVSQSRLALYLAMLAVRKVKDGTIVGSISLRPFCRRSLQA